MKNILIMDDDMRHLAMLKNTLMAEGYECEVCDNGSTALNLLERRSYDILLADVMPPEMKGLELVTRAKQLRPDLTALVMTASFDQRIYRKIVQVGAADFIKKPFLMDELMVRVKHAVQQEQVKLLTFTDDLTGLANRRGIFAFARQQMKLSQRTGERMALLYADLDNFKTINDSWGHDAGDQVLIATARILRESFRDSDIIGRIGGDEFVVILVNTQQGGMANLAGRVDRRIAEHNARAKGSPALSLSMGQAFFNPLSPCRFDDLLREADRNMYRDKQSKKVSPALLALGRNNGLVQAEARIDH
jgi:diguanylate cyclase (GGDEF)-like protein